MSTFFLPRLDRLSTLPGGMVRMDRVTLYFRNQFSEFVRELEAKNTKTVGEPAYRIGRLAREMASICRIAGDTNLMAIASDLGRISERSPREGAIQQLTTVVSNLDSLAAERRLEAEEELLEQQRLLEERLGATKDLPPHLSVSDPKAVFVIMPFRQDFNDVWMGAINKACAELGLTAIRVDMINRSSNITEDIVQSIDACHVAIADVTENNPNVMFELGYAIAKEKPNIIISQSADYLPFDIRFLRTIVYSNSWSGIEELRSKLVAFLKETLPQAGVAKNPRTRGAAGKQRQR